MTAASLPRLAALALAGTLALGVWLRWVLAGAVGLPVPFAHLRHAHSHLGYFGVLLPLAWLGWRAAGAPAPGGWLLAAYAAATAVATAGFVIDGYGPIAIAGSTAVAAGWLWSAWPLLPRLRTLGDPLAVVPPGLVLSLACVPPIALTLRRAPEVAHGFVTSFLAGLLLLVVVPSAVAARRGSVGPWPLYLTAGGLGAASLGVWPAAVSRAGLGLTALLLLGAARSGALPGSLRAAWAVVALGLAAMAVGLLPDTRPVALGAIHFLVLGPVLASLSPEAWTRGLPDGGWWASHALAAAMSAALVAQGLGAGPWTWTASAVAGTAFAVGWLAVGARAAGP